MAKITQIKQQVKRKDRYSIFVDGKYTFSFSEDELINSGVKKDQELSSAELNKLKTEATLDKAYDRVIRYLAIRPRSLWEIKDYLGRKGYEEPIKKSVLARVGERGLVDDGAFARQWVAWRNASRPRSTRQLQAELYKKRISREIIDEVLSTIEDSDQIEKIRDIAARKSKLRQYQDKKKLIAYLARQGFPYSLIKQALDELEL